MHWESPDLVTYMYQVMIMFISPLFFQSSAVDGLHSCCSFLIIHACNVVQSVDMVAVCLKTPESSLAPLNTTLNVEIRLIGMYEPHVLMQVTPSGKAPLTQ